MMEVDTNAVQAPRSGSTMMFLCPTAPGGPNERPALVMRPESEPIAGDALCFFYQDTDILNLYLPTIKEDGPEGPLDQTAQ